MAKLHILFSLNAKMCGLIKKKGTRECILERNGRKPTHIHREYIEIGIYRFHCNGKIAKCLWLDQEFIFSKKMW